MYAGENTHNFKLLMLCKIQTQLNLSSHIHIDFLHYEDSVNVCQRVSYLMPHLIYTGSSTEVEGRRPKRLVTLQSRD